MVLNDIITLVEQKCDGRSLGAANHKMWADLVRKEAAQTAPAGGFHGLYFLYKEASVTGGSKANEGRYQLPDDFIDDLSVWYDGIQMVKAPPGVLNVTAVRDIAAGSLPTWYAFRGLELELVPPPPVAGKEIKLFYNGRPEAIVAGTDVATFHDYFMDNWANLHIFGMAEYALDSVGAYTAAKNFRDRFNEEVARLAMQNRRFWMKGTKMRLQNWDEFMSQQRHLFPQFGNVFRTEEIV
jgi:hypothetical protein